jgi:hypothetical protein
MQAGKLEKLLNAQFQCAKASLGKAFGRIETKPKSHY